MTKSPTLNLDFSYVEITTITGDGGGNNLKGRGFSGCISWEQLTSAPEVLSLDSGAKFSLEAMASDGSVSAYISDASE